MTEIHNKPWSNRIVSYEPEVDPRTLTPHPRNWRVHPEAQSAAVRASLSGVGWVDTATVNQRTGNLVDGHDRVRQALESGATVPVLWVDLTEEEELEVLRDFDTTTLMAVPDQEILTDILNTVGFPEVQELADTLGLLSGYDSGDAGGGWPDLADLEDEYGGLEEDDFLVSINFKVRPEVRSAWFAMVGDDDEAAIFENLINGR